MLARPSIAGRVRPVAVGVLALSLGGCAATTPPTQTGVRIGDETLKQFKAGVTTESWLLAVLGPPTTSSEVANVPNTKVFRYSLGEAAGGIGALFSGEATKNTSVVYFIITDGIVTRFWADRATDHTLLGKPVEESAGEKQAP
jgi:hypothetical protein